MKRIQEHMKQGPAAKETDLNEDVCVCASPKLVAGDGLHTPLVLRAVTNQVNVRAACIKIKLNAHCALCHDNATPPIRSCWLPFFSCHSPSCAVRVPQLMKLQAG